MNIYERVISLFVIIILPVFPACLIWYLFESNSQAQVLWRTATLGGPIAAYFIIAVFANSWYVRLKTSEESVILKMRKRMHKLLMGHWTFNAVVQTEDGEQQVTGSGEIGLTEDGEITVDGHWHDEENKPHGAWTADEIILTPRKLVFVYSVPAVGGRAPLMGLTSLNIVSDTNKGKVKELNGFWGVLGLHVHGTTNWIKTEGRATKN